MEKMGEEFKNKIFQDNHHHDQHTWGFMKKSDHQESFEEEEEEASTISNGSSSISSCSSSFDTTDDAFSSYSSLSSVNSAGSSLLDLSTLMSELPIKRGLSKFYHGKSESFTSLAKVMSIEDLPKKLKMRKMKGNSKSYGGGLDNYKLHTVSKPIISKKLSPFLRQRSFARS